MSAAKAGGPGRESLLRLLKRDAVLEGMFVLSSGRTSKYYIDARRVTLSAAGSKLIGEVLLFMMRDSLPDAVGGMSLGADPMVTAVTLTSAIRGTPVEGLLVRKQQKEHGTGRQIEGPIRSGMKVVVLEDTSTTGSSALQAVEALRTHGVTVTGVITLIDRNEGAASAFKDAGLPFQAVFDSSEIVAQDEQVVHDAVAVKPAGAVKPVKGVVLQTDGASRGNPGPAGAGYVIYDSAKQELDRGSRKIPNTTNNVAEYQALLLGLAAAYRLGCESVEVRIDSDLIVKQMTGRYKVKSHDLMPLVDRAKKAVGMLGSVRFTHVPREENTVADGLATAAAKSRAVAKAV